MGRRPDFIVYEFLSQLNPMSFLPALCPRPGNDAEGRVDAGEDAVLVEGEDCDGRVADNGFIELAQAEEFVVALFVSSAWLRAPPSGGLGRLLLTGLFGVCRQVFSPALPSISVPHPLCGEPA